MCVCVHRLPTALSARAATLSFVTFGGVVLVGVYTQCCDVHGLQALFLAARLRARCWLQTLCQVPDVQTMMKRGQSLEVLVIITFPKLRQCLA